MPKRALVIDDDVSILDLMRFQLESEDFEVFTANNGNLGEQLVKEYEFDIILTDLNMPGVNGIEMVKKCKEQSPNTEIIMITGEGSASKAVEATKAGAFYYVEKPFEFDDLFILIEKAIERKQQAAEIKELRGKLTNVDSYEGIIGGSRAMQNIFEIIENVAESDANILILGESGTGKEVIANAIHYKSNRAKKNFVKVNCSALPKELIESQLFGHTKGAFTGANADKQGLVGQANGGSLLLDEIGEMPLDLQPKLLRILQEKTYYKVGSETPQDADFRLITATNRNPLDAIRDGNLREDLYYRVNTIEIRIPPLRDRLDDIPMLAEHFLAIYTDKYSKEIKVFSESAYNQMLNYEWRGNVRELQHSIERAVLMTNKSEIQRLDLGANTSTSSIAIASNGEVPIARAASVGENPQMENITNFSHSKGFDLDENEDFYEQIGDIIVNEMPEIDNEDEDKKDVFNSLEYGIVRAALKKTNGNKRAAANLLGLYRPRLYGMIKRHKIKE